jgi:hypothetical protein
VSQFLRKELFLSVHVIAKKLAPSPHTITKILIGDLAMRTFARRWMPHDVSPSDKVTQLVDALTLFQDPRNNRAENLSHVMTVDERWLCDNSKLPTIFPPACNEAVPRIRLPRLPFESGSRLSPIEMGHSRKLVGLK